MSRRNWVRRTFSRLLGIPSAIVLVIFLLGNSHGAELKLDPFITGNPIASITVPLYLTVLLSMIFGALLGGFFAWIGQGRARRQAREAAQATQALEAAISDARRQRDRKPADKPAIRGGLAESPDGDHARLALPGNSA